MDFDACILSHPKGLILDPAKSHICPRSKSQELCQIALYTKLYINPNTVTALLEYLAILVKYVLQILLTHDTVLEQQSS